MVFAFVLETNEQIAVRAQLHSQVLHGSLGRKGGSTLEEAATGLRSEVCTGVNSFREQKGHRLREEEDLLCPRTWNV